jgi:hypothetical protein
MADVFSASIPMVSFVGVSSRWLNILTGYRFADGVMVNQASSERWGKRELCILSSVSLEAKWELMIRGEADSYLCDMRYLWILPN